MMLFSRRWKKGWW